MKTNANMLINYIGMKQINLTLLTSINLLYKKKKTRTNETVTERKKTKPNISFCVCSLQ